jgi:hypothetical protein
VGNDKKCHFETTLAPFAKSRKVPCMSSLQRYRKSGGFIQLLSLLESFGAQKKEKFLEMIDGESPVWARALRQKLLSVDRIMAWPDQIKIEVFRQLPVKTMAFALNAIKPEQRDQMLTFFSHAEKRKIDDLLLESVPKPEELSATLLKLVEQARKMLKDRDLHADKFDESLIIPEDFEVKLEEMATKDKFENMHSSVVAGPSANQAHGSPSPQTGQGYSGSGKQNPNPAQPSADFVQLQSMIAHLMKENKALREENALLKNKLETIRKIS